MSAEHTRQTLAELCLDISYGYTASACSDPVGPKFLRITDIQGGEVDWSNVPYCEANESAKRKNQLAYGDIVIARTGNSTGENFFFDSEEEAVFASYLIRFRVDPRLANPYFVWLQLRTNSWWSYVSGAKSGSAQAGANAKVLGQFEISLPRRVVQDRVETVVKSFYRKIQLNHRINDTLEQIAQALFKSWFVDFEPVKAKIAALEAGGSDENALLAAMETVSGKTTDQLATLSAEQPERYAELRATAELFPSAMQDSELGEIPEGWSCLALDTIAKYQNGLALQKYRPDNEDDYLPVVKIAQLKKGFADGEEKASPNIKPDCIIDDGDVVFSWSGSLMVDTWCGGKAAMNQHLFKVTSTDYPKWLYYHFTRHHLEEFQRIAESKAVTMGHIKRQHLREALCAIPDETFLYTIGNHLGDQLSQQITLRLETKALSKLRDTLLPKLLSGELTLPDTDEAQTTEATA